MPMISRCMEPGCSTIAMGVFCIVHTPKTNRVFVRGRPWPPADHRMPNGTLRAAPVAVQVSASADRSR